MKQLRVTPGSKFRIRDYDPDDTSLFKDGGKKEAAPESRKIQERLSSLQEILFAEGKHKVLIVLQGMDTSGKDGAIEFVMGGFDAAGAHVVSFKKPTEPELAHDYLWRIHANVPARGELAIFNRSQYEDVLVVRVHSLVPEEVWKLRYQQIVDFERMLAENGTLILKFFLHISQEEQKERLQARLDDPTKQWKFNRGDLAERKLWDQYQEAYEEAIARTSTDHAPWYVVPANKKWYRNWVIGSVTADAMDKLGMQYPKPDLSGITIE
jgi:PPK2 family polyphosphate:nucleotide phosphotransferase